MIEDGNNGILWGFDDMGMFFCIPPLNISDIKSL